MRQVLSIAFAVALVGICAALLEITALKTLFAVVFGGVLFAAYYAYRRTRPMRSQRASRDEPASKRLLKDLYQFGLAGLIGTIALVYPGLFRAMSDAVWPFLGAALFVLACSIYAIVHQD